MSFHLLLAWLVEKYQLYEKAHGAHGSKEKQRRLMSLIEELFSEVGSALVSCGDAIPSITVCGVVIPIDAGTCSFDL